MKESQGNLNRRYWGLNHRQCSGKAWIKRDIGQKTSMKSPMQALLSWLDRQSRSMPLKDHHDQVNAEFPSPWER
jgi:hypothetical protein